MYKCPDILSYTPSLPMIHKIQAHTFRALRRLLISAVQSPFPTVSVRPMYCNKDTISKVCPYALKASATLSCA